MRATIAAISKHSFQKGDEIRQTLLLDVCYNDNRLCIKYLQNHLKIYLNQVLAIFEAT